MRKVIAGAALAVTAALGAAGGYAAHAQGPRVPVITVDLSAVKPTPAIHRRQLPGWVHWRLAPGYMRDCGHGPAVIVWGGHGDTSALVCKSGKASTS